MTSTKSNLSSFSFFSGFSSASSNFYSVIAISILFLLFPSISAARSKNHPPPIANSTDFIRTSCNATLYPDLCYSSLCNYSNSVHRNPTQLACVAIKISLSNTRKMCTYISYISKGSSNIKPDPRTSAALHDCRSNFNNAVYQMKRSLNQMYELNDGGGSGGSFRFLMSNVQTWMSAALSNEDTCMEGFQEVNGGTMKADVCNRTVMLKKFTSNALALVNTCAAQEVSN